MTVLETLIWTVNKVYNCGVNIWDNRMESNESL